MNNDVFMYQEFYIEQVSLEVEDFIREKQNVFIEEIKLETEKGSTYHIFYDTSKYQDIRFDRVYYYDLNCHEEIFLDDILMYNESFLEELSVLAKDILLKEKNDVIFDDEVILDEGLMPTATNFQYLMFEEQNLKVIFPPYQVGPWSSGAIDVLIPYSKIVKYLKIC